MRVKMVKKFIVGTVGLCLLTGSAVASELKINRFSLKNPSTKGFVSWGRDTLIEDDTLTAFPDVPLASQVEQSKLETVDGWEVSNSWNTNQEMPFRREISVSKDGREIELNFRANQPAYRLIKDTTVFRYSFRVPFDVLKGMTYTAITGRAGRPKTTTGTAGGTLSSTRYVTFKGDGKTITFDFGPQGVGVYGDYGPGNIQALWSIRKEGDYLLFSFGCRNTDFGGVIHSKVKIYAEAADSDTTYLDRHSLAKYSYYDALPQEQAFCFGAPRHGKNYKDAGAEVYSEDHGAGWLSSAELAIESQRDSGALYSAVVGRGENRFRCDLKRPGLYIFTLRCTGYGEERGPFSVQSNGRKIVDKLTISPLTVKNITWSQWIEKGASEITFDGGSWAVSALSIQMLQHSSEDYRFRRGFWRANGLFEPHPLNANACFAHPPKYAVDISEMKLSQSPVKDPKETPVIPRGGICLPSGDASQMDWRYNAVISSLGPSNSGNFTEFDTEKLINRRLQEKKESGINTILLNGLLSRHTFPGQLARVKKTVTEIAAVGHQKGMKILDHQDVTLLWNMGQGFRVMCAEIGKTQRSIDGNLPLRGFCINNTEFMESYFRWLVDYIKDTDIDGIMLDEGTFYQDTFCGCIHCRKKFTEDTGLVLPLDETSPLLFNKNSTLWQIWLQWRMKAVGDFSLNLRCSIMPVKPNFTIMKYTTHYGFSSNWSPLAHGASMAEAARSCDFLGTEIMSRNVMASYRAVFAFRKAKSSLRTAYGSPVFGLVYPMQSADFAYFGWALNNMNAQITWMMSGRVENEGADEKFLNFKNNFSLKYAVPVSEIALLYPTQSRNWAKYMAPIPDVLGASQMLTDEHIMHDVFIEQSMDPSFLMKYRAVMVNSANALSDEQIKNLLQYAGTGGTLYLTASSGTCDQTGNPRKQWPFSEALGVTLKTGSKFRNLSCPTIRFMGKEPIEYGKHMVRFSANTENPPVIIAEAVDKNGKVLQPLIVEHPYGNGRIIYCAAQLGAANYEIEKTVAKNWIFSIDEAVKSLFIDTVRDVVLKKEKLAFEAVEMPEGVIASVYSQNVGGKNTTVVNLLNAIATESMRTVGEKIPSEAPSPAWVSIEKDLVFDISLPSVTQAFAVSPDWDGEREIKATLLNKGVYRVTVPKELLECYIIIKLES